MSYYSINKNNPIVLASISARRKAILTQIGIPFETAGSRIEESHNKGRRPVDIASETAKLKVESVKHLYKGRWILGADTIVVINKRILGKPKDSRDCHDMLLCLSGNNHRVITGFCIFHPGGKQAHIESVITKVKIKEISEREIEAYIKTGEPFGKAGGYAIQGIGSFMVEYINGSYTNVVGLPVCEVVSALVKCGGLKEFPFNSLSALLFQRE